jgi:hypothetical protein
VTHCQSQEKETLAKFYATIGEDDNNYLIIGKLKQPGKSNLMGKIKP